MVSALLDDRGVVGEIRVVTRFRPEYRADIVGANLRKRADAYLFGGFMAARHGIDAAQDCAISRRRRARPPSGRCS